MDQFTPKEVRILETVEDIQERREQVLNRYNDFKVETRQKREKLEDSRRFQYFKRGLYTFSTFLPLFKKKTIIDFPY